MDCSNMVNMATSVIAGFIHGSTSLEEMTKEVQELEDKSNFGERKIKNLEREFDNLKFQEDWLNNKDKCLKKDLDYYENKYNAQTKMMNKLCSSIRRYELNNTCLSAYINISKENIEEDEKILNMEKDLAAQEKLKQIQLERSEKLKALTESLNLERKELVEQLKNTDLQLLLTDHLQLE